MPKKRAFKLIKGISAILFLTVLVSLPLALIAYAAVKEKDHRMAILDHGVSSTAIVTESKWLRGFRTRSCAFRYQYSANGQSFQGGEGGCPLVSDHPVGSTVNIRISLSEPKNSVPIGGTLWPGWAIVPALLALPILLLLGIGAYAVVRDPLRPQRKRSAARGG